jgi:hypothetical protein
MNASSLSVKVPFCLFIIYFKVLRVSYLCSYVLAAYLPELECVQPEAEHEEVGATRHGTPRAGTSHRMYCFLTSVADPGCLSWILIFTHPGSRIQKQHQKRGVKKISCHTFFCNHKFHKIKHY